MKYGIFYAYWVNNWGADYCEYVPKVKRLGFDMLEIGAGDLLKMSDREIEKLRDVSREYEIAISCNLGPPKSKDVGSSDASVRAAGVQFLCDIMKKMTILGSDTLIGALYTFWPYDFVDLDKEAIWARSVASMKKVGECADTLGVNICLEALNRFESNLINTAEEGVRYCRDVDHKSVKLLLDTFHMNIEEDNMGDAIRLTGDLLGHVHIGEGNRKLPGMGHLPWAEIGKALRDIGYTGGVVMEPFMQQGGTVGSDIKVWRDLTGGADSAKMDSMAADAVKFLRKNFENK